MVAMLKSQWRVLDGGKVTTTTFCTEVEVTAETTEDTFEEVLEAIRELVVVLYGEMTLKCDWNSNEIFRLAERMV